MTEHINGFSRFAEPIRVVALHNRIDPEGEIVRFNRMVKGARPTIIQDVNLATATTEEWADVLRKIGEGEVDAIIGGGSGDADITVHTPLRDQFVNRGGEALDAAANTQTPVFAICFFDHVAAEYVGGRVENDEAFAEGQTAQLIWTSEGNQHPVSKDLVKPTSIVVVHKESVVFLPDTATVLAVTERDKFAAVWSKANITAIQGHPDYTPQEVIRTLVATNKKLEGTVLPQFPVTGPFSSTTNPERLAVNFLNAVQPAQVRRRKIYATA